MRQKKVSVNELTGAALDYAVALVRKVGVTGADADGQLRVVGGEVYSPSTSQQLGGDLIDEYGIATRRHSGGTWYAMLSTDLGDDERAGWSLMTFRGGERFGPFSYQVRSRQQRCEGPTRLVASMRILVVSQLGLQVMIPSELLALSRSNSDIEKAVNV